MTKWVCSITEFKVKINLLLVAKFVITNYSGTTCRVENKRIYNANILELVWNKILHQSMQTLAQEAKV